MWKRARNPRIAGLVLVMLFAACTSKNGPENREEEAGGTNAEMVEGTGTVVWRTVEGGLYVIEADNGTTYDPLNLPSEYSVDGLRVSFEGKIRTDLASIHMAGTLLEITTIRELEDPM